MAEYFGALQALDIERLLACFTPSVYYSHPAYRNELPDGPRHEVHGSMELRQLMNHRGKRASVQQLDAVAFDGTEFFAGGSVTEADVVVATWVSRFRMNADGRVAKYVAYSSAPGAGLDD